MVVAVVLVVTGKANSEAALVAWRSTPSSISVTMDDGVVGVLEISSSFTFPHNPPPPTDRTPVIALTSTNVLETGSF